MAYVQLVSKLQTWNFLNLTIYIYSAELEIPVDLGHVCCVS